MLKPQRHEPVSNNMHQQADTFFSMVSVYVLFTLMIAAVLSVFPLQRMFSDVRPFFIFLVILMWVHKRPQNFGIWFAFIVGLMSDLLMDTRLGHQAISGAVAILFFQYATRDEQNIHGSLTWLIAAITITIFNILLLLLQTLDGEVITIYASGIAMLVTIGLWPIVNIFSGNK